MLVDTHSHIYSEEFNGEIDEVIKRAVESGVEKILLPNIDSSTIKRMLDVTNQYQNICYPMIGIHPTSVKDDFEEELEMVEYWLKRRKFYGIGEIGIDLYWDNTYREEQEYVFKRQLFHANELGLPVSIHTRDSFEVAFNLIKQGGYTNLKGVFHCFSGNVDQAKEIINLGFKIGVGGVVTFKNSGVESMLSALTPEDIVLETDSPYLAPSPYRGKRNESSNLIFILKKVAEIYDMTERQLAEITTKTATELFKF